MVTTCLISALPGPNMIFIMTLGARYGLRRSAWAMPGCLLALVMMMVISAAGLATLLNAWPSVFAGLRLVGAAYLIYQGIKIWRTPMPDEQPRHMPCAIYVSDLALCRAGFLVGASNPKAMLFSAALLPQFVNASAPILPQIALLVITFAVFEVLWYVVYAGFGVKLGQRFRKRKAAAAFNGIAGGALVALGAYMAIAWR
jgi:threonine/homoserine/homoserine lactone efflux protein